MADAQPVKKKRRKRRINKSAIIRDYIAEHPDMGPTAIAEDLRKRKIKVTATYVSDIKAKMKTGAVPGKRGRKKAAANTSATQDMMNAGQMMMSAIDLVMKAGYKEAKSMVEMASKMVDRVRENGK
jgi:hypothetical protein